MIMGVYCVGKVYSNFIQILGPCLKNEFLTLQVLRNKLFINSFKSDKKTFSNEDWK